jgi:hypothetical protein
MASAELLLTTVTVRPADRAVPTRSAAPGVGCADFAAGEATRPSLKEAPIARACRCPGGAKSARRRTHLPLRQH